MRTRDVVYFGFFLLLWSVEIRHTELRFAIDQRHARMLGIHLNVRRGSSQD